MSNKVCGLYSIRDLDEISLNIKNESSNLSGMYKRQLANRYNANVEYESNIKAKIAKLTTYFDILQKVKEQTIQGSGSCLDRESLQNLIEKIKRITGKNCRPEFCDIKIDKSQEEVWVIKRPYCRSYEEWEKWSKVICGKLHLEVNAETEVAANLIFEITREIITPNILMTISAYTEVRENLQLEISRTDEEIKLDFELLVEKLPSIDLSLDIYTELIKNHKLSFDMVKEVYSAGLSLEITSEEVELKTPINAYTLSQISGNIDPTYLEKFGMKATINKKDLLQDYK